MTRWARYGGAWVEVGASGPPPPASLLYEDFTDAVLDTGVWTRVQSVAGNVEIVNELDALKMLGSLTWGQNGLFSVASFALAEGLTFLFDVYPTVKDAQGANLVVGVHDGVGQHYTDFHHGLDFAADAITIFQNGTSRGNVGAGYTPGDHYRVRMTVQADTTKVTFEMQGGPEYEPIGGATWTDVTPATNASNGASPVHIGATVSQSVPSYVSLMRVHQA